MNSNVVNYAHLLAIGIILRLLAPPLEIVGERKLRAVDSVPVEQAAFGVLLAAGLRHGENVVELVRTVLIIQKRLAGLEAQP